MEDITAIRNIDQQLIEGLYVEAIVLADEARSYFSMQAQLDRSTLGNEERLDFACESLKVSTRIMHSIAWLLFQRAIFEGELSEDTRLEEQYQLGAAQGTDPLVRARLSPEMEGLILVSEDLYNRVARLEEQFIERACTVNMGGTSPAHDLLGRLNLAF